MVKVIGTAINTDPYLGRPVTSSLYTLDLSCNTDLVLPNGGLPKGTLCMFRHFQEGKQFGDQVNRNAARRLETGVYLRRNTEASWLFLLALYYRDSLPFQALQSRFSYSRY